MEEKIKLGVVGLGNMGSSHLAYLKDMENIQVVAVCDILKNRADAMAEQYDADAYYSHEDMFAKATLDAVIIATPHFSHTPITVHAFQKGLHVLCEKPIAVHVDDAKRMLEAYEKAKLKNPHLIFGMMFQERTAPHFIKIKDILTSGELGRLTRVTWINTHWFRSQAYYDSGGWRATWAGEGGGILTNQCPHNLDMYNWLFGLPKTVDGFAHIGKLHNIEVEDEVTAYFEHEDGMIGHFIVCTGECPGVNRLEIVGENGTLLYQDQKLIFYKNRQSMITYCKESTRIFGTVENWETKIPIDYSKPQSHRTVTEHFAAGILKGNQSELIATGNEGLNPVMLANAIMLSSFERHRVELPLDGADYAKWLEKLAKNSRFLKAKTKNNDKIADLSDSAN